LAKLLELARVLKAVISTAANIPNIPATVTVLAEVDTLLVGG
jgi:hypothetical protein